MIKITLVFVDDSFCGHSHVHEFSIDSFNEYLAASHLFKSCKNILQFKAIYQINDKHSFELDRWFGEPSLTI